MMFWNPVGLCGDFGSESGSPDYRDFSNNIEFLNPCRLVRQVDKFGRLGRNNRLLHDPFQLVWQVKKSARMIATQTASPAGRARRGRIDLSADF
jgi:hypothetical protein